MLIIALTVFVYFFIRKNLDLVSDIFDTKVIGSPAHVGLRVVSSMLACFPIKMHSFSQDW